MIYRKIEAFRGAWGLALLADPDRVLATVHGVRVDSKSRVVARILGARHLTQAVLSGYRPSRQVLAMGVWVDGVHALSALALAAIDRDRARAGLTDATIAACWSAAGYRDLVGGSPASGTQRIRDRLAILVLSHVPAGRSLLNAGRHEAPVPVVREVT